jgi:hypothetical protein
VKHFELKNIACSVITRGHADILTHGSFQLGDELGVSGRFHRAGGAEFRATDADLIRKTGRD